MNVIELQQLAGFRVRLASGGREVTADTGERLTVQVEDVPLLTDPVETARQKLPLFVRVHAVTGDVVDPRAVGSFTEVVSQKKHTVQKFEPTSQNNWEWCWFCETQRD